MPGFEKPAAAATTAAAVQETLRQRWDVSHETLARLETYAALLQKWQPRINLIAPSTVPTLWHRHILDSAQILPLLPASARSLVDLGSGAGFPGLVLAILTGEAMTVALVEADQRKAAFLHQVIQATGLNARAPRVTVHAVRIEALSRGCADVVTARGLTALPALLPLVARFLASENGVALLSKGRRWQEELTAAAQAWTLRAEPHPSLTDREAVILRLSALAPLHSCSRG